MAIITNPIMAITIIEVIVEINYQMELMITLLPVMLNVVTIMKFIMHYYHQ